MRDDAYLAKAAAKERVTELFRSAGGMKTIENLALALSGAPPEKIESDIAAFTRKLEVNFAKHEDWPTPEFADVFIAATAALIRARLAEISNTGSGSA
ncbi:MAG TPA: hypothetical protein VIE66_10345 [Methylocella sp.]|jgi:hypothetical protein